MEALVINGLRDMFREGIYKLGGINISWGTEQPISRLRGDFINIRINQKTHKGKARIFESGILSYDYQHTLQVDHVEHFQK